MDRVKLRAALFSREVRTIFGNTSRLVEGAAFLVAAYYNYTGAYHARSISTFEIRIRVAASVVIGLRGAYELGRWLANKEIK